MTKVDYEGICRPSDELSCRALTINSEYASLPANGRAHRTGGIRVRTCVLSTELLKAGLADGDPGQVDRAGKSIARDKRAAAAVKDALAKKRWPELLALADTRAQPVRFAR